jgi:uncharacterized membrane protein YphA (DoxX/SURF4 family)
MKIGRLLLRLSVGGFFFGHGAQKLFGWFGGHGLEATAAGFEQMGLRPADATRSPPAPPRRAVARCSRPASPRRSRPPR